MSAFIRHGIGAHAVGIAHVNARSLGLFLIAFAHVDTSKEIAFGALVYGHRGAIVGSCSRFGVNAVNHSDAIASEAHSPVKFLLKRTRQLVGGKVETIVAFSHIVKRQLSHFGARFGIGKHQCSRCGLRIGIKREGVTFASLGQTQVVGIHTFHCGLFNALSSKVG